LGSVIPLVFGNNHLIKLRDLIELSEVTHIDTVSEDELSKLPALLARSGYILLNTRHTGGIECWLLLKGKTNRVVNMECYKNGRPISDSDWMLEKIVVDSPVERISVFELKPPFATPRYPASGDHIPSSLELAVGEVLRLYNRLIESVCYGSREDFMEYLAELSRKMREYTGILEKMGNKDFEPLRELGTGITSGLDESSSREISTENVAGILKELTYNISLLAPRALKGASLLAGETG